MTTILEAEAQHHHNFNEEKFLCVDCGYDTHEHREYYMVQNEIWGEHGAGDGMLCIGCLEKRMGRELTPKDFTGAPLNQPWFDLWPRSERLNARLGVEL